MAHAQNTITIDQPPETVYAFLADGLNNPKWRDVVVSIDLKSGEPATTGAEYRQIVKGPGGSTVDADYRLTTAEPVRELAFVVTSGPARPTGRYLLSATTAGTEVTFTLDYSATGMKKLLDPLVQKAIESDVGSLTELKRVLEAP
jgi:uncharacterized membrane protein